jgi:divalent metal cation (Fe/Co/Zn/Cd) transporter
MMNKVLIAGIFAAIFVAGLGVITSNQSISFGEFIGSLKDLNPRVMGLLALPVIAVVFVLGTYLYKRKEERKWKKALLKTRARKQNHGKKVRK